MKHCECDNRNVIIIEMFRSLSPVEVIATKFEITPQRVRQILRKMKIHKSEQHEIKMQMYADRFRKIVESERRIPSKEEMRFGFKGKKWSILHSVLLTDAKKMGFHRQSFSDKDLIEDLMRLYKLLGRNATTKEINKLGRFSAMAYHRRFGSLVNAQVVAGLEPSGRGRS